MIRFVIGFLVLLSTSLGTLAQESAQFLFDEANTLLENNEYSKAMNIYRTIEQGAEVSGALFLNMGIASTQLDSMGLAKYYFLKSAQFNPTNEAALEALQYVESQFSRQSATLPKLPWDNAVDWLKTVPGIYGVFFIGFAFILLTMVLNILKWFKIITYKKSGSLIAYLAVSGILVVLLAFYVDYVDQRYTEGVIVVNEVQVRTNPEDASEFVSIGYEGYAITIDNKLSIQENGWLYVRLGNGQFGWIKNNGVKTL